MPFLPPNQQCQSTEGTLDTQQQNLQQPVPPTDNGSVCRQSGSQCLLLRRSRCFFPSGGNNHRQYSFVSAHGRMVRHPLSTTSISARHLLDFIVQGKITETDAPTTSLDTTLSRLSVPHFHHTPIFTPYAISATTISTDTGLGLALNNASLHTQWLG